MPESASLQCAEWLNQRFYRLLEQDWLDAHLYKKLILAEEAIYTDNLDPMFNWDADDLRDAFALTGLKIEIKTEQNLTQILITNAFLKRLFTPNSNNSSYAERLSQNLTIEELENIKMVFTQNLLNQTVMWGTTISFLKADRV